VCELPSSVRLLKTPAREQKGSKSSSNFTPSTKESNTKDKVKKEVPLYCVELRNYVN
jgi:hypothetical protein